jgi:hypothetical protein
MSIINRYKIILLVAIIIAGILYFSYSKSMKTAKTLVGSSLEYFQLTKAKFSLDPVHKKSIGWAFEFSNPDAFDAGFEIYTSMFGQIVITNPTDLNDRLRGYEKLNIYPYPKIHRK